MNSVISSLRPYVFHRERMERYHDELQEIERRKGYPDETLARKKQALDNLCWSEFIDAKMVLQGKRVRITKDGFVLGVDYTVLEISRPNNPPPNGTACFALHCQNDQTYDFEKLEITPTTKIHIYHE